jgi:hypothetical protein
MFSRFGFLYDNNINRSIITYWDNRDAAKAKRQKKKLLIAVQKVFSG